MIFEKKKINIETLSEYLTTAREALNLSQKDVALKTGIKPLFLNALEEGKFNLLPADVYALGFLRQLANVYSVEPEVLIEQYKKERNIDDHVKKKASKGMPWTERYFRKLVITPKLISIAAGVIFVAASLGYIIWQVLSINKTPSLEIFEPRDRQVVSDSFVNVRGKTEPGMSVTVNDQSIFVDTEGGFKTQVGIGAGPKQINITARNKFEKSITKNLSIIGESAASASTGNLALILNFSDDVSIKYVLDGQNEQSAEFHKGDSKTFSAKIKILISTSNAGATLAKLNGQDLGPLGRQGESLQNIPFSPATEPMK